MPLWAFKANFTNASRRTAEEISFHDMLVKSPRSERKTVTHVYAQSVTHVYAPCREGGRFSLSRFFLAARSDLRLSFGVHPRHHRHQRRSPNLLSRLLVPPFRASWFQLRHDRSLS